MSNDPSPARPSASASGSVTNPIKLDYSAAYLAS